MSIRGKVGRLYKIWDRDENNRLRVDEHGRQLRRDFIPFSEKDLQAYTRGVERASAKPPVPYKSTSYVAVRAPAVVADAAPKFTKPSERWVKIRRSERYYAGRMMKLTSKVQQLQDYFNGRGYDSQGRRIGNLGPDGEYLTLDDSHQQTLFSEALARLASSEVVDKWARAVGNRMIEETQRSDAAAWKRNSQRMSKALLIEIETAPTGALAQTLLEEQVTLIKSIPLEAAQRVHKYALEARASSGERHDQMIDMIMRTGGVSRSRAKLIARTETARAASVLTEARARYVGSEGYIWRSVGDADVRNIDGNPVGSHRLLNGTFVKWDEPPVASTDGTRAHAGCIYNCRCWADPVLPGIGTVGDAWQPTPRYQRFACN